MKILKAIKNELKENWGYVVGAVIGCLITQRNAEKYTRLEIEHTLSMGYLYDDVYCEIDGIQLDHYMTYGELMNYLRFKVDTKPNKKKKIKYLKENGFIN